MLTLTDASACAAASRTYRMPVHDVLRPSTPSATATAPTPDAIFQLRLRDALDFTIDMADWLTEYSTLGLISAATWSTNSNSLKQPVIVGQSFDPTGYTVAVISAATNAAVGDAYLLDVTVTIAAGYPAGSHVISIPARTIVRHILIEVVSG